MPNYIALLRGINVAGHNLVAMAELRQLFAESGFDGAKSLLQSGNVIFRSTIRTGAAIESRLEKETAKRLNVTADYFVRSAMEWREIIAANPYPQAAKRSPNHLVVMFLKSAPPAAKVDALCAAIQGPETLQAGGRHLYIVYPAGIGRSKLTGALIERTLGFRGTARNWNTVQKLAALCEEELPQAKKNGR